MKPIKTFQGVVYPWNCDQMGHMNVQFYTEKFDQATWTLFAMLGLTASFLRENNRGMAALEQHIQYKKELLAGDCIYIETTISEIKEKIIKFQHTLYH